MSKILVSGSIAYDRIMDFDGLFADHFLPDKLHAINLSFQVRTIAENFGGCAGNIAYSLELMNGDPSIVGVAGHDFTRYAEHLRQQGIDASSVRINKDLPTSMAFIMTDKADNQIAAFSMGAAAAPYEPLPDLSNASLAIVSAGNPADMRVLPAHYKAGKVPYFFDPAQAIPALSDDDLRAGIEGSAGLFGNDYEMTLMMQRTGWGEQELLMKTPLVVTTLGVQGTSILTSEGKLTVPAVRVESAVDPTGAGDAYRAGFIKGTVAKLAPKKCAQLASTVAAYAVESLGTQNHTFSIEQVAARYETAYGETLAL